MALPLDFFFESITEKYDNTLKIRKVPIDNIADFVNESFQEVTLPSFSDVIPMLEKAEAVSSTGLGAGMEVLGQPNTHPNKVIADKTFTITWRHANGYMNYFCLWEHMFAYRSFTNKKMIGTLPLIIIDEARRPLFILNFLNCKFVGMDALNLSHTNQNRDFINFTTQFQYEDFSVDFVLPEVATTFR